LSKPRPGARPAPGGRLSTTPASGSRTCDFNMALSIGFDPRRLRLAGLLLALAGLPAAGAVPSSTETRAADPLASPYGRDRFGNAPPASFTYAWPAAVRLGDDSLGEGDSLEMAVTWVESLGGGDTWDWLAGVHWRRQQFNEPDAVPLPDSLQAAAAVFGVHWRINERWRLRGEVQPGIYSDFQEITGSDVNVPVLLETAFRFHDRLEVGVQLNVDPFREFPVVGAAGVTWRMNDRWLLSLWIPRPQIEFAVDKHWTLFGGASLTGGSYRVGWRFGQDAGRPELGDAQIDFQEVRVGAGARIALANRFTLELAGGWVVDRRFDFHERDLVFQSDGAPYVQFSLGAAW